MIYIGSDHRGVQMKQEIYNYLINQNIKCTMIGPLIDQPCDYPDIAHELIDRMDENSIGILLCHTANGMAMTANKYSYIRAAICWNAETAIYAKLHNNANVLCIPAGYVEGQLYDIIDNFIITKFEGGRHQRRIEKM